MNSAPNRRIRRCYGEKMLADETGPSFVPPDAITGTAVEGRSRLQLAAVIRPGRRTRRHVLIHRNDEKQPAHVLIPVTYSLAMKRTPRNDSRYRSMSD